MFSRLVSLSTSMLLVGFTITSAANAQNNPKKNSVSQDIETELVSIAEASIRAEYDVQVNGDEEGAKKGNPKAAKVRDAKFQKRLAKSKELKTFLKSRKVGFKNFQTKLDVKDIKVEGNVATMEAVEDTSRYYDLSIMASDSPEKSEELIEHRFSFALQGNQWELISDEIQNAPGSIQSKPREAIPLLLPNPNVIPADPLAPPTNQQSYLKSQLCKDSGAGLWNKRRHRLTIGSRKSRQSLNKELKSRTRLSSTSLNHRQQNGSLLKALH